MDEAAELKPLSLLVNPQGTPVGGAASVGFGNVLRRRRDFLCGPQWAAFSGGAVNSMKGSSRPACRIRTAIL